MFVRCVDAKNSRDLLKQEQIYKVVDTTDIDYVILFADGKQIYFRKSRFVVEQDYTQTKHNKIQGMKKIKEILNNGLQLNRRYL